jgi:hypothetical protein
MGGNCMLENYLMKIEFSKIFIIWQACVEMDKVPRYYTYLYTSF